MKKIILFLLLASPVCIHAQTTYTQTDTAGVSNIFSCDGTTATAPTRVDSLMSQVIGAGTAHNVQIGGSATQIGYSLLSPPNITVFPSGTWTVRLDVTGNTSFLTWDGVCIFLVDSAGTTNKATVGTATGLGISVGTTGVKSTTVSGAMETPLTTDKIYIEYVFINSSGGSRIFTLTSDSTISSTVTSPVPTISSITVAPSTFTISAGGLQPQLNATATYSDSEQANVTATASWSSNATTVATVASGLVTGVSAGSATITATQSAISGASSATVTVGCQAQDIYGGLTAAPSSSGGTGYFRVEKTQIGHWTMVSPLGNRLWVNAVYGVNRSDGGANYTAAVAAKYSSTTQWATFQLLRMKQYCLNMVSVYSDDGGSSSVFPYSTFNNSGGSSTKMPFIISANMAATCTNTGAATAKNLYASINPAVYTTTRSFPDVFDAAWANCLPTVFSLGTMGDFTPRISQTAAYMVGIWVDDGDNLFGFGKNHPHLGWVCASVSPTKAGFTDTNVYCKSNLVTFLTNKYGTIGALNTAWGSNYTTFGSSGGWPKTSTAGTGLLDEDGSSAWIGNGTSGLTGANAGVKTDLDLYLFNIADKYATTVYSASKTAYPNHLAIGPQGPAPDTYSQVLGALEKTMDVLEFSPVPLSASTTGYLANPCNVAITYGYSCKPQLSWTTLDAPADSEAPTKFWGSASNSGSCNITGGANPSGDYTLQTLRGTCYGQLLDLYWSATANNGIAPLIGIDWWEWPDKVTGGENTNFGFVSQRDNPYGFGLDATGSACSETQGTITITDCTETVSHGDFITAAQAENAKVINQLIAQPSSVSFGHLP